MDFLELRRQKRKTCYYSNYSETHIKGLHIDTEILNYTKNLTLTLSFSYFFTSIDKAIYDSYGFGGWFDEDGYISIKYFFDMKDLPKEFKLKEQNILKYIKQLKKIGLLLIKTIKTNEEKEFYIKINYDKYREIIGL
jgi:hypothetical protein